MKKISLGGLIVLLFLAIEFVYNWTLVQDIRPFPWAECWYHALNGFLRDLLPMGVALFLYRERRRIKDRTLRYFPVVVVGILYLLDAVFMVTYLEMDTGFMTVFPSFSGCSTIRPGNVRHAVPPLAQPPYEGPVFPGVLFHLHHYAGGRHLLLEYLHARGKRAV